MTTTRTLSALLVLVVSTASATFAQDAAPGVMPDEYQAHLDRGLAEYEAGHYESAAGAFEAAYALRPEPDLQYNIARSYERAVKREEAIAAYELFLELPGTTSDTRTRALRAVASLRAEIEAMNAAAEPAASAGSTSEGAPLNANPQPPAAEQPPQESGTGAKTTAGWVLVTTGAVSLVAGAITGGLALAANTEFEDSTVRSEQVDLADKVNNYALAADILLGAGLVLGVVGVVLIATDSGDEEPDERVRVTPAAGPSSVGLMVSGTM